MQKYKYYPSSVSSITTIQQNKTTRYKFIKAT